MVRQTFGRSRLCSACCESLVVLWAQGGYRLEACTDIRDALVAGYANQCREIACVTGAGHTHTKAITIHDEVIKFFASKLRLRTTPLPTNLEL